MSLTISKRSLMTRQPQMRLFCRHASDGAAKAGTAGMADASVSAVKTAAAATAKTRFSMALLGRLFRRFLDRVHEACKRPQTRRIEGDPIARADATQTRLCTEDQLLGGVLRQVDAAAREAHRVPIVRAVGDDESPVVERLPTPDAVGLQAGFFGGEHGRCQRRPDQQSRHYRSKTGHGLSFDVQRKARASLSPARVPV